MKECREEIQEEAASNNNQDLTQLNKETPYITIIGIRIIEFQKNLHEKKCENT